MSTTEQCNEMHSCCVCTSNMDQKEGTGTHITYKLLESCAYFRKWKTMDDDDQEDLGVENLEYQPSDSADDVDKMEIFNMKS